jgi:hypothetical protein
MYALSTVRCEDRCTGRKRFFEKFLNSRRNDMNTRKYWDFAKVSMFVAGIILFSGTVWAQDAGDRLDNRGDRIEERLDNKGDRIDQRLDNKGDRIDGRLDQRGDRIDGRLDRASDRAADAGRDGLSDRTVVIV